MLRSSCRGGRARTEQHPARLQKIDRHRRIDGTATAESPLPTDWTRLGGVQRRPARCDFRRRVLRRHALLRRQGRGALRLVTRDFRCWHFSDTNALGGSSDTALLLLGSSYFIVNIVRIVWMTPGL